MAKAVIGHGSKISVGRKTGNVTTYTYTVLADVQDITLPDAQTEEIEITSQDSAGTRQYMSGLTDNGEVTFDLNRVPGSPTDVLLSAIKKSGETVALKFEINGASEPEIFEAFLKGYQRTAPVADKQMATCTFRISAQLVA